MKRNESKADRVVRVVLAVAALVAGLTVGAGSVGGVVLLVIGVVLGVTAAVGFCPLYALLGLSTRHESGGGSLREHASTAS